MNTEQFIEIAELIFHISTTAVIAYLIFFSAKKDYERRELQELLDVIIAECLGGENVESKEKEA